MAPDKIYVPQHNIEAGNIQELDELIVSGSTEYIRKDALLEWAKELQSLIKDKSGASFRGAEIVINEVINKIESL